MRFLRSRHISTRIRLVPESWAYEARAWKISTTDDSGMMHTSLCALLHQRAAPSHHHPIISDGRRGVVTVLPQFCLRVTKADHLQKSRQLGRGLVLRNWLQLLERAGEGVRRAPHGPWLKLIVYRLKVQFMNSPRQMLGEPCFFRDECQVDEQPGSSCRQLHGSPFLYLLLQGTKVPLHAINTDDQAVFQREVLRVLCQYCGVIPMDPPPAQILRKFSRVGDLRKEKFTTEMR